MRTSLLLFGLVVALGACGSGTESTGPTARQVPSAEPTLVQVTSHLSAALAQPDVRAKLIASMAESRLEENQLFLREYLASSDGAWLLESVASAAGVPAASYLRRFPIESRVAVVVPMVRDRAAWDARTQPVVAYALGEVDAPVAVGADGSATTLSATSPPLEPLVLVRGGGLAMIEGQNRFVRADRRASVISAPVTRMASFEVDCNDPTLIQLPPECGSGTGGGFHWVDFDRGVYMYDIQFDQTDEPFWDPNPEYDIMVYGRDGTALNPYWRELVSCASWGTPRVPAQQFSVTNSVGTYLAPVRLFDGPTLDAFVQFSKDSVMTIEVVEDDKGESCKTESEANIVTKLKAIIGAYQTADKLWKAGVKLGPQGTGNIMSASAVAMDPAGPPNVSGAEIVGFAKAVIDFANAASKLISGFTADDFLGLAMTKASGVTDLRVTILGTGGERGTAAIRIKNTPLGTP